MDYRRVDPSRWQALFDAFGRVLEGQRVEIEIFGLDLGDQIEAEWLPLNGLTYDPSDEAVYVYTERAPGHTGDGRYSPREVWVEVREGGLSSVVVVDREEHKHIVRFRAPLELPEHVRSEIEAAPA